LAGKEHLRKDARETASKNDALTARGPRKKGGGHHRERKRRKDSESSEVDARGKKKGWEGG